MSSTGPTCRCPGPTTSASKDLCTVISHNAGGYSFFRHAEHQRVTRFRPNGVPLDRPGHYVYLRDDDTGEYWSISWQPVGKDLAAAKYECRHGLSYSKFSCDYRQLHAEQTMFIPLDDDVELWDVRIRNTRLCAAHAWACSHMSSFLSITSKSTTRTFR